MKNDIVVYEGLTNDFIRYLKIKYDYLEECKKILPCCELISNIDPTNDSEKIIQSFISKQKESIKELINLVNNFEKDNLEIDTIGSYYIDKIDL